MAKPSASGPPIIRANMTSRTVYWKKTAREMRSIKPRGRIVLSSACYGPAESQLSDDEKEQTKSHDHRDVDARNQGIDFEAPEGTAVDISGSVEQFLGRNERRDRCSQQQQDELAGE